MQKGSFLAKISLKDAKRSLFQMFSNLFNVNWFHVIFLQNLSNLQVKVEVKSLPRPRRGQKFQEAGITTKGSWPGLPLEWPPGSWFSWPSLALPCTGNFGTKIAYFKNDQNTQNLPYFFQVQIVAFYKFR